MHVIVKLASLGVQTAKDFERLALIFGNVVTVTSLASEAFPPFDVPFTPVGEDGGAFTIVVEGVGIATAVPPYDVPFDVDGDQSIMESLFNILIPRNCNLIFRNSN